MKVKDTLIAPRRLEPVSRSGHRPRRRDFHQEPADVDCRLRRGMSASCRSAPGTTRSRKVAMVVASSGKNRRRDARQTTSTCATSRGRSALLLGKAKDNNASASLGPFIRLFDKGFGIDDVKGRRHRPLRDRRRRLRARGQVLDEPDLALAGIAGQCRHRPAPPVSRRLRDLSGHHVSRP